MRPSDVRGAGEVSALERVDVRLLRLPAAVIRPTPLASEQTPEMEPETELRSQPWPPNHLPYYLFGVKP